MMYNCKNGIEHKKDEWCREEQRLTVDETIQLVTLLKKISRCHLPHSAGWVTAGECPACWALDFLGGEESSPYHPSLFCAANEELIFDGREVLGLPRGDE